MKWGIGGHSALANISLSVTAALPKEYLP